MKVFDSKSIESKVLFNNFFVSFYVDCYCDLPLGLFIVRGDNVVVFGEVDEEKEKALPLKAVIFIMKEYLTFYHKEKEIPFSL